MSGTEWWKSGVVYQIYPRSFADSDGDGVGDLPGITGSLEYLTWLGVDAIWLSPIFVSPMADFGYDVSDYTDVDPLFGTLSDFEELTDRAHRLGLKVILDFVPNHTSFEHPWFVESSSSQSSPKRDWYIWADPADGGVPPNNWRGLTKADEPGSAWTWDEGTGQYFLATFSPAQPDLNWREPEVREAMLGVMRFWLERGADGFRIDMIDWLGKDAELRDDPPLPEIVETESDFALYAVRQLNRPETYDYIRLMREAVDEYGGVAIGEVAYGLSPDRLVPYYGDGELLHLPFNFNLITLPLEAERVREFVAEYDDALLEAGAWPNYCLGNHDNPRVSRHGGRQARLATMMLLTLRGTPFLYYGDELSLENVEVPEQRRRDPWTNPLTGEGRDPERTPMQWSAGANAGFSVAEPWLPVGAGYESQNVEAQKRDPGSTLSFNRALLGLRRRSNALSVGDYRPLEDAAESCFAYLREGTDGVYLISLNFGYSEISLTLPLNGKVEVSTLMDRRGRESGSIVLRPGEGCVVELDAL